MKRLGLLQKTFLIISIPTVLLSTFFIFFSRKTYRENLTHLKQNEIRQLVQVAAHRADEIIEQARNQNLDPKKQLERGFKNLFFDETNYFFVFDDNGYTIVHSNKNLLGKSLIDFKDKGGVFLVREMKKITSGNSKSGFVDYHWPSKNDENKIVKKLAYAQRLTGTDMFIGAGVYMDEVSEVIFEFTLKMSMAFLIGCGLMLFFCLNFLKRNVIIPIITINEKLKISLSSLKNGSNDMENISNRLALSTSELSSSLDQTAAAVVEIDSMIQRTVERSKESEISSKRSAQIVHDGVHIVEEMVSAINNISTTNENVTKKMERSSIKIQEILGHIKNIEDKTTIINDIVFQTKLLSFNASVEAARAGEQGKGFSVVAEEVGNLAVLSGKSASEISEILNKSIEHVQSNVEQTQTDIKDIISTTKQSLNKGVEVAKSNKEALEQIQENVHHVIEQVVDIVAASEEQSRGVNEINDSVKNLDQISKLNLESSTVAKKISKNLNSQTNEIERNIIELQNIIDGGST